MASRRLDAAMAAGVAGGVWLSPRDLRDAHEFVFCGENLNLKEDAADFAEFDLCWTQMCAALGSGEPWATAWIKAAAVAERDEETIDEINEERLHAIYEALKAGQAPSTA